LSAKGGITTKGTFFEKKKGRPRGTKVFEWQRSKLNFAVPADRAWPLGGRRPNHLRIIKPDRQLDPRCFKAVIVGDDQFVSYIW